VLAFAFVCFASAATIAPFRTWDLAMLLHHAFRHEPRRSFSAHLAACAALSLHFLLPVPLCPYRTFRGSTHQIGAVIFVHPWDMEMGGRSHDFCTCRILHASIHFSLVLCMHASTLQSSFARIYPRWGTQGVGGTHCAGTQGVGTHGGVYDMVGSDP
jgi:hypothetical protein